MMQNRRILKNTVALYIRQVAILLINLYALRVVLNVLGIEGYGIYTAVAGFVTLLTFLPGSMASATQRFFSFAMGGGNQLQLKQTFCVNWIMYASIALIVLLILQTIGLWFVTEQLKIPYGRENAAIKLYHMVVFGFIATLFASPFIAIIIAHEDMHLYALIAVLEAIMKLISAMALSYIMGDSLVLYGILLFVTAVITTMTYVIICIRKYSECQFKKIYWNKSLLKEIISFTGWTIFGQLSTVFRNQAVTVLINQLFNPATVAARAIALTVSNQALIFSHHLNTGLYPPIIKSYAADRKEEMFGLIWNGSKLTFFLMWVFALPMLVEMETILHLWLETPPPEAIYFCQLALIESLIVSFSLPLTTAARAPGRMRLYELSLGSIQVAIFYVSWIVLKAGYSASSVFYIAIMANLLMFKVRLIIVKNLIGLPLMPYYTKVMAPIILVITASMILALSIDRLFGHSIWASIFVVFGCLLSAILCTYFLGLDRIWRGKIKEIVVRRLFSPEVNA